MHAEGLGSAQVKRSRADTAGEEPEEDAAEVETTGLDAMQAWAAKQRAQRVRHRRTGSTAREAGARKDKSAPRKLSTRKV